MVRLVESTGRPSPVRVDLPMVGRVLEAELGAHQLRTFRVPWDPARPVVDVDLVERPLAEPAGWFAAGPSDRGEHDEGGGRAGGAS